MQFKISKTIINRVRVLFLVGIFAALYHYLTPILAFSMALYCILVDIADLEEDITEMTEDRKSWRNLLTKRGGF